MTFLSSKPQAEEATENKRFKVVRVIDI